MRWWRIARATGTRQLYCALCKAELAKSEQLLVAEDEQTFACSLQCGFHLQKIHDGSGGARLARRSDSGSSAAAAEKHGDRIRRHKDRVLAEIRAHPGITSQQIADQTGIKVYDVRKRTAELRGEGRVRNQAGWKQGAELARWFPLSRT